MKGNKVHAIGRFRRRVDEDRCDARENASLVGVKAAAEDAVGDHGLQPVAARAGRVTGSGPRPDPGGAPPFSMVAELPR